MRRSTTRAGDDIADREAKKHETRAASCSAGGLSESLLHVPAFWSLPNCRVPAGLLSFEKQLDAQDGVRVAGAPARRAALRRR